MNNTQLFFANIGAFLGIFGFFTPMFYKYVDAKFEGVEKQLRTELKAETGTLRAELKAETGTLRAELKAETGILREEMKTLQTNLDAGFERILAALNAHELEHRSK
jgi:hypothetical protein